MPVKTRTVVLLLAALVTSSGAATAATGSGGRGAHNPWIDLAKTAASVVPPSLVHLIEGSQALNTGSDGRLTVLLLGSDTRAGGIQRTDTIMVMSLHGNSISSVSIPRDTARIPNPDGGQFSGRINAIAKQLRNSGLSNTQALAKFKHVIESLLQIEIDYYALVTFNGFESLVHEVEPVTVKINKEVKDSKFWDDPNFQSGVYFPTSSSYDLYTYQQSPPILCNGQWRSQSTPIPSEYWCHRAMPFVRSRKGAGNSDFVRARRQQDFVLAAIKRVLNRGSGTLNSLVNVANSQAGSSSLITDIPLNTGNALDLFNRLNGASADFQAVFSPPTYATHIPGGTAYELKLDEVRKTMKQWFGSTGSPPPTPTPSPTSGAAPTPTATSTLAPGQTPTPLPTPTFTLAPGQTPTPTPAPTPTLAPGETATPAPTLAPGETATPAPTLAPGEPATPAPTLAPGQTATPTAVAGLPGEPTPAVTGEPGGPAGQSAQPSPDGGSVGPGPTDATTDLTTLIVAALLILLFAGALLLGWRRLRAR